MNQFIKQDFILDFYKTNKRKYDCILSLDDILELNQKWFSNNYFKDEKLNKFLNELESDNNLNKDWSRYGRVIFGLTNGTLFTLSKSYIREPIRDLFHIHLFKPSDGFYSSSNVSHITLDQLKVFMEHVGDYGDYEWVMKDDPKLTDKIKDIKSKYFNVRPNCYELEKNKIINWSEFNTGVKFKTEFNFNDKEMEIFNLFTDSFFKLVKEIQLEKKIKNEKKIKKETKTLENKKLSFIKEFDKNNNGIIDIIEESDDFMNLVKKHQGTIINIDKSYIQDFVKISNYLKTKKENLQSIFNEIKTLEYVPKTEDSFEDYLTHMKDQIHTYNLILVQSFNMVVSLVEQDLITFYEIHELFDKLNMFNSNWENEVSNKLSEIGDGLDDLIYSINKMERNIILGINNLSFNIQHLNSSITKELKSIDSSIKVNNLYSLISTYQLYKINKQTKPLLPKS